ncbi:hypothetical protein FBEOM_5461 [Fusarium beomiforme]|uniref:Clr5 domain-containing protein n=1 Tax=Fusarium beomiforme TaxID=44412 RepID=A0A9P5DZ04_9HYPO|nr:hypothetical protein FBEOM_5461 [Fusarium beomiforme]
MPPASKIPTALWEAQKARITELYVDQDKTLDEVIETMAESGFNATKKQYIRKVNVNWKLQKNYTKAKWQHASALVRKRESEGKATELMIDGKIIPEKRIRKELRRYHSSRAGEAWTALQGTSNSATDLVPRSLDIMRQRLQELMPTLDDYLISSQHKEPAWLQIFNSIVALYSNNLTRNDKTTHRLLELVISSGFLLNMKQLLTVRGPTMEVFAARLLFVALGVKGTEGIELIRFLLDSGISPDSVELYRYGNSALYLAVEVKNKAAVELLLRFGSDPNAKIHVGKETGESPLELALDRYYDRVIAETLINFGADVNFGKKNPLILAVKHGDFALAKQLLKAGANPNVLRIENVSALHTAIHHRNLGMVDILIEAGANTNLLAKKLTKSRRKLMSLCFDNRRRGGQLLTPIQLAVRQGDIGIVRLLIKGGAVLDIFIEPKILMDAGQNAFDGILTPLQLSIQGNRHEITKTLLEAGAGVDFRHPATATALQFACGLSVRDQRKSELIQILLMRGANINALPRENAGRTALQAAAESGDYYLLKFLLSKGGNPFASASKKRGLTLFQAAFKSASFEIVDYVFWDIGTQGCSVNYLDGTNYLEQAASTGDINILDTVLKFWNHHGLHWYEEDVLSAIKIAILKGFTDLVGALDAASSSIIDENSSSLLCESIWGGDRRAFDLLMERSAKPRLDYAQPGYPTPLCGLTEMLVSKGADIHCFTDSGGTPLHVSLECKNERATVLFLQQGADPNTVDFDMKTVLGLALDQDASLSIVQLLIDYGADVNKPSLWGTPIEQLLGGKYDRHDTLLKGQLLLEAGADLNASRFGRTPLELAVARNKEDLANLLIEAGADINALGGGMTALEEAANNGNTTLTRLLVKAGADVKIHSTGVSALQLAIARNTVELVKLFIEAGADVNAFATTETALQTAAQVGNLEVVKCLIEKGEDINAKPFGHRATALQFAAMNGNVDIVKCLVENGASINAEPSPEYKATALQLAIESNHTQIAVFLIENGASVDPNPACQGKTTFLQIAASKGNRQIVTCLVENGAAVNAAPATCGGATALQFAAINGNIKMAVFLLENGARVNAPASQLNGRTALEGAVEHGRLDMVSLLLANDEEPGTIEERCRKAAKFAEAEHHNAISRILRDYKRP